MLFAVSAAWALKSVSGPATLGVLLSIALVARLAAGDRPAARSWAFGLAGLGFSAYLVWLLAVLFVLPAGDMDLAVFLRAGREAADGRDPYLFRGDMVFLSPPPALGAFRLASALPDRLVGGVLAVVSGLMTVALVPLSNRLIARDHDDDPEAASPLPADVAALLGAALVNSNASIWGHRSGQLCAPTAFLLLVALLARRRGRFFGAGACLAVAAFKPATVVPFLVFFLRKTDRRAWLALALVSFGLSFAAGPPGSWPTLVRHNLHQIGVSGGPGRINDYDFSRSISSDILAFNHLYHRAGLRDRGLISALQWASVGLLLGWLYSIRERRPFGAVASLAAAGSLLVLYHRVYDAVILALPLAYGSSLALRETGRRRAIALGSVALLLAAIDQPREALIPLTRWTLGRGLTGWLVQAVVLPYATWSILLAMLGLALCAFPPGEGPTAATGALRRTVRGIIALVALAAVASAVVAREGWRWGYPRPIPFDRTSAVSWLAVVIGSDCRMYDGSDVSALAEFVRNHRLLIGKTRDEVVSLLGTPERRKLPQARPGLSPEFFSYRFGTYPEFENARAIMEDPGSINLEFDLQGRCVEVSWLGSL